jgi:antitoxin HicB
MPNYKYYGLLTKAEDGLSMSFPDLKGCLACGVDMQETLSIAEDVLGGYLMMCEDFGEEIPPPSSAEAIKLPEEANLILVEVNTDNLKENVVGYFFKDNK